MIRPSVPALFAVALLALPALAQKSPATRLDTSPPGSAFSFTPQICCDGDRVYVAWSDTRNGLTDVYFNRSLDRGATWLTQDVRLNAPPTAAISATPKITCEGSNVYVVWSDFRNGGSIQADIYFNVSNDAGTTWLSQDVRINTDPIGSRAAARCPAVCADQGNVYVAWLDNRNGANDIYSNRSLDGGATWLASDVRVDTDPAGQGESTCPGITCVGDSVYVGWNDLRNGAVDIYFNRSIDAGATWLASDIRLDTDAPGTANSNDVALAADGTNVYFAWWDARNGEDDIYFNRSLDNGATWLASDIRIDTGDLPGASLSNWPEIGCDGDTVYVIWEDWRNGSLVNNADVYFNRSEDAGATWLDPDILISRGNVPYGGGPVADHSPAFPKLSCDGDFIHVAWGDIRNGSSDIYYNRSMDGGDTWLVDDVRLEDTTPGFIPAVAPEICGDNEAVYVVWQDSRFNQPDIYMTIPSGWQQYGAGSAGSGGIVPDLIGDGTGLLGTAFGLHATQALGGSTGAILLGTERANQPIFGGTLLVQPALAMPVVFDGAPGVPGAGNASLSLTVPNDEALVGQPFFFQAGVLDPPSSGVVLSNAVELWIG